MIGTISPLVQVAPHQWRKSILLYVFGSSAGGILSFGLVGVAGWLTVRTLDPTIRLLVLAVFALLVAGRELQLAPWPIPSTVRSVPKSWWQEWGPDRAALAYGFVLGVGISTVIPFATFYLLACWTLLSASIPYAAVIGLAYGFARSLPAVLASTVLASERRVTGPWERTADLTDIVLQRTPVAHGVNGLLSGGIAGAAIAAAVLML